MTGARWYVSIAGADFFLNRKDMNRITKTREEIGGLQVDITFYGKSCVLSEKDKWSIYRELKNGKRSGKMGTEQPGRDGMIWTSWSVPFESVKVGDTVGFSTSGKYNPGFTSTETYIGCVERITDKGKYFIKSNGEIAIVPLKHIERVIK